MILSVIGDEPGVGEPAYGVLEADDAAERGRHPNGTWSIKQDSNNPIQLAMRAGSLRQ
jgi:hypothetical protein